MLELFAWLPLDLLAMASGWPFMNTLVLMFHLAIAVSGLLMLRRAGNTASA